MRAYTWLALGSMALACGGSAFTSAEDGNGNGEGGNGVGEGGNGEETGGALNRAGRGSGGSSIGSGGSLIGSGGKIGVSGSSNGGATSMGGLGIAGDLVVGGTPPIAGSGGSAGTAGTAGTGPDPIDESCPKDKPEVGGGCAAGLTCTYGTDVRPSCRLRYTCSDGKWTAQQTQCPEIHSCDNVVVGAKCDATEPACLIDGYIYCVCTGCSGAGPCSDETTWQCAASSGGNGCPKVIPNEGQPCGGSDAQCGYGSCATGDPMHASCSEQVWNWNAVACPL